MVRPSPPFRDILDQAENHEIFLQTLHNQNPPQAAFTAQTGLTSPKNSRDSFPRGRFRGSSLNRDRSTNNRRPPHCQLCRKDGHYVSSCPSLTSYAQRATPLDANLAQAFNAQCSLNPDWTADSGAPTTCFALRMVLMKHTPTRDQKTVAVLARGTCEKDSMSYLKVTSLLLLLLLPRTFVLHLINGIVI